MATIIRDIRPETITPHVGRTIAAHGTRGTLRGAWRTSNGGPTQLAISTARGMETISATQVSRVVLH